MTKRENFNALRTLALGNDELVAFIDHELELLDKKNKAPKKPTDKQLMNEKIKDTILDNVLVGEPMTATEIAHALGDYYGELSTQRVSAIISQLIEDNSLVRTVVKRKAYFSKA